MLMFSAVFVVKEPVADCENNVGIAVQKKVGICLLKRGGGYTAIFPVYQNLVKTRHIVPGKYRSRILPCPMGKELDYKMKTI